VLLLCRDGSSTIPKSSVAEVYFDPDRYGDKELKVSSRAFAAGGECYDDDHAGAVMRHTPTHTHKVLCSELTLSGLSPSLGCGTDSYCQQTQAEASELSTRESPARSALPPPCNQ